MRFASLQRRFLFRSSALLISVLTVWWFLLQGPMLLMLYAGARIPFGLMQNAAVTIGPSGDWSFRIPVQDSPDEVLRRFGSARIDSMEFTAPGADILPFTLGLPVYWAVALAVPGRRRIRLMIWGSLLQLAIGVVSLVLFAEAMAYNSLGQMRPDTGALARWVRDLGYYLVTAVVPYAAPVIAAVWLHPWLRLQIFSPPAAVDAPIDARKQARKQSRKHVPRLTKP